MGIKALPHATVRALGASQVLTDPAAVVKELLDNALDANATSIAVEVHDNTLDIIQVRDNGHGIASEDRPLVARRYCTSKITHDDELQYIGGSSLGFRGEALASAAELSGSLTISTRVEGEEVAAALKINQQGEIIGEERSSLPVGTTVKITEFIKANPVRKQTALKNSQQCLKTIKGILHAYAFARHTTRFSMRVLKAKNNKSGWIYAPKANGNAEDAAFKIVGAACASQCLWSVIEVENFAFQAFLPRPNADPNKISNVGSFLSLDSRPVSVARGTLHQVVKAYREVLKGSNAQFVDIKEPFLYLEINCPKGSYDVNVEPSKNDVIFVDPNKILEGARRLFGVVYSQSKAIFPDEARTKAVEPHVPVISLEEDLPMPENISGPANAMHPGPSKQPKSYPDEVITKPHPIRSNMYGFDEEDLEMLDTRPTSSHSDVDFRELREARQDVTVSNPWVFAKLNSPIRSLLVEDAQENLTELPTSGITPTGPPKRLDDRMHLSEAWLPTPRPSSPSRPSGGFHAINHSPCIDSTPRGDLGVIRSAVARAAQSNTANLSSGISLHTGGPTQALGRPVRTACSYDVSSDVLEPSARQSSLDASPNAAKTVRPRQQQVQQHRVNKPFVQPYKDQPRGNRNWHDRSEGTRNPGRRQQQQMKLLSNQQNAGLITQSDFDDLYDNSRPLSPPRRNRDIRDFTSRSADHPAASFVECRNYGRVSEAGANEREKVRAIDASSHGRRLGGLGACGFIPAGDIEALQAHLISSPGKNVQQAPKRRKMSERRILQELSANVPVHENTLDEARHLETRARPASRQHSSKKLGRSRSSRVPLERVPAGQGMHNVAFNTSLATRQISQLAGGIDEERSLLKFEQSSFELTPILCTTSLDLHELTNNLHDLLIEAGADTQAPGPDSLFHELQAAFAKGVHIYPPDGTRSADGDDALMLV